MRLEFNGFVLHRRSLPQGVAFEMRATTNDIPMEGCVDDLVELLGLMHRSDSHVDDGDEGHGDLGPLPRPRRLLNHLFQEATRVARDAAVYANSHSVAELLRDIGSLAASNSCPHNRPIFHWISALQ